MAVGDIEFLRDFLKSHSGLALKGDKQYLFETRLIPVARKHGLEGLDGLITRLRQGGDKTLERDVSEAMNTHESLFFRDNQPFKIFREQILPNLLEKRRDKKSFRIWCAACSSGQEPYSLAMLMAEENLHAKGWRPEIIATDISHEIIDRAAAGIFTQFEVQRGLPVQLMMKYFTQVGDNWQLSSDLRDMVHFRHFNLMDSPRELGQFDVVFCRNVLIYFDVETKTTVLNGVHDVLHDEGVLFLGGAESTFGISEAFEPVPGTRGVYRGVTCEKSLAEK